MKSGGGEEIESLTCVFYGYCFVCFSLSKLKCGKHLNAGEEL
jgi:hypothetical protein